MTTYTAASHDQILAHLVILGERDSHVLARPRPGHQLPLVLRTRPGETRVNRTQSSGQQLTFSTRRTDRSLSGPSTGRGDQSRLLWSRSQRRLRSSVQSWRTVQPQTRARPLTRPRAQLWAQLQPRARLQARPRVLPPGKGKQHLHLQRSPGGHLREPSPRRCCSPSRRWLGSSHLR